MRAITAQIFEIDSVGTLGMAGSKLGSFVRAETNQKKKRHVRVFAMAYKIREASLFALHDTRRRHIILNSILI